MKKSQKEIVLELLKQRGEKGVHSYEGYKMYIPRIAAIINKLKKEGYNIFTRKDDGRFAPNGRNGVIYILEQNKSFDEPYCKNCFWGDLE
ncbi:MAG TPA: hypothetical protein VKZ95_06255 [Sphingobacteriaceae bacterium]|nr:hypothetical protein [Sphingobacteriaceae bacterium]